ncbi:YbiU family protein [Grimontia sp. SpTr1]|uniref:YbiU family protein n=1 Tax=Grimontia sp. SpTr1 TaxID=2995319 RepID=UPI00248AA569|nr:YbiU family protein [Grimontia sp. SpTr1]
MALSKDNLPLQIKKLKATLRQQIPDYKERFKEIQQAVREDVKRIKSLETTGSAIPVYEFSQVQAQGQFSAQQRNAIHQAGCCIIRNTLPTEDVQQKNDELSDYIVGNGYYEQTTDVEDNYFSQLKSDKPQIFGIYWSKPQIWARQHPNMAAVRQYLNALWVWQENGETYFDPTKDVTYADRVRRREPGDTTLGLSPHVDAGSVERWLDPSYRKVFEKIFGGDWRSHNAFHGAHRINVEEFPSPAVCSVFRSFQGWLALTSQGQGDGTLKVVPSILTMPYILLRALQDDVPEDSLCGAEPCRALTVSEQWHSDLLEGLVSIPKVNPGDTVWWHPDTIHAVEDQHTGDGYSNVLFIGAAPSCQKNIDYSLKQKAAFLKGESSPDFAAENYEVNYKDRATETDLSALGRQQMGFDV